MPCLCASAGFTGPENNRKKAASWYFDSHLSIEIILMLARADRMPAKKASL
jgi:hypothetical protein